MNPQLFELYRNELQHLRDMGGEFAAEFPKVAGRLGLETLECADPYVERLLEGFAFLAARVQLKLESSHAALARQLLEMVYPDYLSPTPSMLVAELFPTLEEGSLAQGFTLDRGTRLRSQVAPDEQTECDFRTAHDLTLWPVQLESLRWLSSPAAIEQAGASVRRGTRSALALKISTVGGMGFNELPMDTLSLYLAGGDGLATALYEQLFARGTGVSIVCQGREVRSLRGDARLERQGFEDDEALLPVSPRGFQGYRLLLEYFAFPERFLFARVANLRAHLAQCRDTSIELVFPFDNRNESLLERVRLEQFRLHCVPAVNLFAKTADRIHVDARQHRFHILPDRARPMDFEIHSVRAVEGIASGRQGAQAFYPYFRTDERRLAEHRFYSLEREPRLLSSKQKRRGPRASYTGSEVFLSLVDADHAPYRDDLRQLSVQTLCTNRDLPLQMPIGRLDTDFQLDVGAPVASIRCLSGPTTPRPSRAHFRDAWRLVSNLNLNYLSIDASADGGEAAAMLRQMLELYTDPGSGADSRQLEGLLGVTSRPVVRQRIQRGHIDVARGVEVTLHVDESAFEGVSAFLFGTVMERFLARYASINSFVETVLRSNQRDEVHRWDVRLGQRSTV